LLFTVTLFVRGSRLAGIAHGGSIILACLLRESGVFQKEIEIRWRDLDGYAHVNHAVYVTYLEEARDEWLTTTLAEGTAGWDHVLVHLSIDYRRQLTQADDVIVALCEAASVGTSSITTREELRTRTGELAAEARAVVVALDPASGRSRPLTERERGLFAPPPAGAECAAQGGS